MRTKYNWSEIQLEFLSSDIMEVKEFFEVNYSTYTGHTKAKTKWWSEYKKMMIATCKEKAENEIREQLKELYKPSRLELAQMHKGILNTKVFSFNQSIVKDNSGRISFKEDIKVRELEVYWRIIRTEMWLPIRYSRNQNFDQWINDLREYIIMYERA